MLAADKVVIFGLFAFFGVGNEEFVEFQVGLDCVSLEFQDIFLVVRVFAVSALVTFA